MSKELEALKRYKFMPTAIDYDIVEKALRDKEKKDKALEIIKEKRVWVDALIVMLLKEYNDYCKYVWNTPELTQEEYDFLKEILL